MLNYSKLVCLVFTCWTLSNAPLVSGLLGGLVGDVVDTVVDVVVPGGIENAVENAYLCGLTTPGLANYYGYQSDTKNVTTADGYILTMYCVYNSTARNTNLNPVVALHGLMDASHGFCLNYPNQSLAFLLADRGYYVCLPNARGNGYSQGYVNASKNSNILISPYWRFSWDQIAEFDLPAVIDAVLDCTGKSKVIYVGHSQGTTTMFALLSSNPAYNAKIAIFIALSPVAYLSRNTSPLFVGGGAIEPLLHGLYGGQFLPNSTFKTLLLFLGCTLPTEALCKNLVFFAFGYSRHIDDSRLPVYMCHAPSNFAWGQILQYFQHAQVNKFQKFDFKSYNQQIYGQSTPPQYDLTQVTAPVVLYHSDGDKVTNYEDVDELKAQLPNIVDVKRLPASVQFSHIDYVWGKDVAELVYSDVFIQIQPYST